MMMPRSSLYEVMMVKPWRLGVVVLVWVDLLLFLRFERSGCASFLSGCHICGKGYVC